MVGFSYTIDQIEYAHLDLHRHAARARAGPPPRRTRAGWCGRAGCAEAARAASRIVEVLVAIAIIGLLMALAAPSATTWIQNNQLRSAADSILNGIQIAAHRGAQAQHQGLLPAHRSGARPRGRSASTTPRPTPARPIRSSRARARARARRTRAWAWRSAVHRHRHRARRPATACPRRSTFDSFGRVAPTAPINITRVDVRNPDALRGRRAPPRDHRLGAAGRCRMCDPKLTKATNPQGCK